MCWFSMAKLLMFVFNAALFFAGAATLGVGIWISTTTDNEVELAGVSVSQNGAIVLIATGAVTLGMGFLGCCGAKNENSGCLGLYFFLLLILVILQIAVGIWAAVTYDSLNDVVGDSLNSTLKLDNQDDINTLNSLSEQFDCCGRTNVCADLKEATGLDCTCGITAGPNCGPLCTPTANVYNQTCAQAITNSIEDNMKIIAGIGIGIGIIEILGLLFSWCMCQAIKEKQGYA